MFNHRIKAFTLIELVIVVTMIWILMMATTIYLWWFDEKSKIIDWQWCARSIGGEINNFLFYTLTSKNLRLTESEVYSPNYYIIEFTWWNGSNCTSGNMCDKINLAFTTWINADNNIKPYKTLSVWNTCQQNRQPVRFYRSWTEDNSYIVMNKWFIPIEVNNRDVLYIKTNSSWKEKVWDVIVWLCLNSDCSSPKQIAKFAVDARSQTITTKNCRFYQSDDPTKCRVREWEKDEWN